MNLNINLNAKVVWFTHLGILLGGCVFLWVYFNLPASTYYFYFGLFLIVPGLYLATTVRSSSTRSIFLSRTVYLLCCCLLILAACLHADNINSYGPLVADTIHAVYQTSLTEIIGYVYNYVSTSAIVIASAWIALTVVTGIILSPPSFSRRSLITGLAFGFTAGAVMVAFGKQDVATLITEANDYQNALSGFTESREKVLNDTEFSQVSSDFEGNIIVVLGESSTRHHFGIYNYVRNTTPMLAEIRNELNIFTDIISTHSHTVPSLTDALSFSSRTKRKKTDELADIVNVAKKAQFYTAWLSNQNAVGIWDNLVAAIARQADLVKYHDPASGTQRRRSVFDMEVIDSARNLLTDNKHRRKLMFVHLMATHFPYCEVVPDDFARDFANYDGVRMDYSFMGYHLMKAKKDRGMDGAGALMYAGDCYDRAVRYVDSVLRDLIESLRQNPDPTLLLYLSDHGEAPVLGTGHESRMHSHFHVEIPFVVWSNDAYKSRYPEKTEAITNNTNQPGSLVDFSYYLSDIAQISGIKDVKQRSIFSSSYEAFSRKTLHESIGYDTFDNKADYSERTRANLNTVRNEYGSGISDKVWAHRVNTIGAMLESRELFSGLEMDLVFDSDKQQFFVYHPPAPNVGLNLQTHLRQDNGKTRYWFDWKNASKDNFQMALARLEELHQTYNIKPRVILESGTLDETFTIFQKNGWHTSYYLPTKKVIDCIKKCNNREKQQLANKLLLNRQRSGYDTVSFDHRLLEFYDSYMDEVISKDNVKVYTWNQKIDVSDKEAIKNMEKLISHQRVGVLLVNFPSPFDL